MSDDKLFFRRDRILINNYILEFIFMNIYFFVMWFWDGGNE